MVKTETERTKMSNRQKRLDKAQLRVLFQVPFFAAGVARLPVVFDDSGAIPTACTDGEKIIWDGAWFDELPDAVLPTVLCHEACHCMLGHLWRLPPAGGDHGVANEAADHAVNLMLKEFSELVLAKRLADPFPFPADAPGLADPQYKGMAEEVIYAKIMANRPKSGCEKPQGGGAGKGGSSGQGAGNQSSPAGNGGPNAGRQSPSFGEFQPKPGQTAAKAKAAKTDWEGTLLQAVAATKGRGDIPASLQRLVDALVKAQINWWDVLRSWLREQCSDDWTWNEPAMEYSGASFILPQLKSEKCGPVVFATDTSGSIDLKMLAHFQSEKQSCLDEMRPKSLLDIYCDAKVQKVAEYSPGDIISLEAPGGGGTSFVPVWKEIEKRGISPKAVVFLTDGDGETGTDPGYPIVWVVYNSGKVMPFGDTIHVKPD